MHTGSRRAFTAIRRTLRLMTVGIALAAATAAGQSPPAPDSLPVPGPVLAAWQTQKLVFTFQSKQSVYSCEAVGAKVWRTLLHLGARPDMHISVRGCENSDPLRGASPFGFRSSTPITLRIDIATPYEPEPIDREGVTGERGRRELLMKTAGQDTAPPDLAEQFPALWSRVKVSDLDHLEPGDCELIQQIERQLFQKLSIRVVENQLSCLPGRRFRGQGLFEVEALLPLRGPDSPG